MKIITWNCQGAFRKKAEYILAQYPDILVVQECEHPDKFKKITETPQPTDFHWYGDNSRKGIGIFSYSDFKFELLDSYNPEFRYILPFRATREGIRITFFAIWAMPNKENYEARYIGQVWRAINHYVNLLEGSIILIGDFNSNKIWDNKKRVGNHTDVVNKLRENKILSTYHNHFNQEQGEEKQPTFFLQRKKEKPYHIDYCFASSDLIDKLESIEIGAYHDWIIHSDHTPLTVKFKV